MNDIQTRIAKTNRDQISATMEHNGSGENELKRAGAVLLEVADAFWQQGRMEEAMEVSSGVLALSRHIKVCQ